MARRLTDLYQQPYCVRCLSTYLEKTVGKAWRTVLDEASYRELVVDRAWEALPAPIRAFGRDRLGWDRFCLELRRDIFDIRGDKVIVRPDLKQRMGNVAVRLFDTELVPTETILKRKETAPPKPPAGASVPLATPVRPAAPAPAAPKPAPEEPVEVELADSGVAVGIDLGTTYSVVAHLDAHDRPCTITNAAGDLLTPSVVLFDEGGVVVGKEAVQAATMEPEKIADVAKRDMGSKAYRKKINGEFLPPEVISSFILKSLKADADRKLGRVSYAVITVPAYFDESRRRATMDAGKLAGLEVLDIINEPTAAALAYGYQLGFLDRKGKADEAKPLKVLVFDLGGGTFDVTIMEIQGRQFKALATDGDVALGGKDWDEKLIELAAEAFRKQYREDPRDNPVSLQELWQSAEVAKKTLTERPRAAMYVNHLGARLKVEVTREEFEQAAAPLLGRTRTTTEIVVRQSGLKWAGIDRVLLVGGSTRMPAVATMLQELSGKVPERSVSPDEAVAHGAALYADLLMQQRGRKQTAATGTQPRFAVTNVNSHSLGIVGVDKRTGRKRNHILIPKNTPLPATVTQTFKTHKPNQRNVVIRVVEGESERPEACIQLGTCAIKDLPKDLPAGWPGQVSYTYEANGRLHVNAKLKGHATGVTTDFERDIRLEDEDLRMWTRFVAEESGRLI